MRVKMAVMCIIKMFFNIRLWMFVYEIWHWRSLRVFLQLTGLSKKLLWQCNRCNPLIEITTFPTLSPSLSLSFTLSLYFSLITTTLTLSVCLSSLSFLLSLFSATLSISLSVSVFLSRFILFLCVSQVDFLFSHKNTKMQKHEKKDKTFLK